MVSILHHCLIFGVHFFLFDYRETRQAVWPKEILRNFTGHLQTDGYKGYDWVNGKSDIIHLGCMAHARRPFAELVKLSKKTVGKSHEAVLLSKIVCH